MKTPGRRRTHIVLAVSFGIQIPIALYVQAVYPALFEQWWKGYLVFLSLYAIVVGHWSGASAETPMDDEP